MLFRRLKKYGGERVLFILISWIALFKHTGGHEKTFTDNLLYPVNRNGAFTIRRQIQWTVLAL